MASRDRAFRYVWYSRTRPAPYYYSPSDPKAPETYQATETVRSDSASRMPPSAYICAHGRVEGTILLEGSRRRSPGIIAGCVQRERMGPLVKDWQNNGGNQIKRVLGGIYAQLNAG